jgi:2',3'-cyclic-nucleotide 2'-phosphodiesterase (5'-nucleotidase family)
VISYNSIFVENKNNPMKPVRQFSNIQISRLLFISIALSTTSCNHYFRVHNKISKMTAVTDSLPESELSKRVATYITPLHDSLDSKMNAVIVQSVKRLTKGQPESDLGNLIADLMLATAREKTGKQIDVAVTNNGGIRAELPQGGITIGNVYEIMPFDNELVILTLSGPTMKKFVDYIALRREPQAGMELVIDKNSNQVLDLKIGGQQLDLTRNYTVITSDYVANGGDRAEFLKERLSYEPLNLLMRDAYLAYFRKKGEKGEVLNPKKDGRTRFGQP